MKIQYKGFMREKIQKNPVSIGPDASYYEARNLIHEKGVRHLPVVDKNNMLIGIVTDRDIREAAPSDATLLSVQELNYLLGKLKVSSFMTPKGKLITITPDTIIEEAVQLMHDNKIGCLPVVDEGRLYGIFTERDALDHLVDIFGFKQKGTRLTVALEDKPGTMSGILEVFKKYAVNVISIVSPSFLVEGKRIAAIRIETKEYEPIVEDLEKAGYPVLSVGKWPSTECKIPQIKKILYATDLSENSAYAFHFAVDFAQKHNANIIILHVVEPIPPNVYPYMERVVKAIENNVKEAIEEIKNRLERFCRKVEGQIGRPCIELVSKTLVPLGNPVEEILNAADREACDLIILGTHGKGFLANTFLGSVSSAVLHRARKPVFIIPLPSEKTNIDWDKI